MTVTIPEGASAGKIGDVLANAGVVDSGFIFSIRASLSGARGDLRSGRHVLHHDMSYSAAIDALSAKPTDAEAAPVINVTIPEGRTRRDIAAIAGKAGLSGSYMDATAKAPADFSLGRYGAPRDSSLEGFLFPATYELRNDASAATLRDRQLDAFRENIAKVDMTRAKRRNLDVYDVLIIASMVEREARVAKERPIIAAVIANRLREDLPLGIDATIRYATNNWSKPLTESELKRDSPYNTRLHRGLPPTPIGNPGLAAIKAAANPAEPRLPLLRRQARHVRRARVLPQRRAVRARRRALQRRARGERRQVPDEVLRRLGVFGWPVAHSRSPAMHAAALAAAGLEGWTYQRLPVPPGLFTETARALGAAGFRGANVTIPHKEAALALADDASPAARAIGAANTLTYAPGGEIHADNTDAPGLLDALEDRPRATAVVLGAGGSARAVVWALQQSGAEVRVWNRTPGRAAALGAEVLPAAGPLPAADLLVNCTSVGLGDPSTTFKDLPVSPDAISTYATLVDLVYRPGGTALELAARERRVAVVGGLEVLVRQGARSFAAWTGITPDLAAMRIAVADPP